MEPATKRRLIWAYAAYAVLIALSITTLDGKIRLASLVFLAGLAVKTWLAAIKP